MASHEFKLVSCKGGEPTAAEVLAMAKHERDGVLRVADASEARREAARAELAKRLAEIDAAEVEKRAEVEAYDRAIKRIEKKVTT